MNDKTMNIIDLAFLCSEELLWRSNITEGAVINKEQVKKSALKVC